MWPELGSNEQGWDDEWFRTLKISILNHSATGAANCWVIKYCLEVSCKVDYIMSEKLKWYVYYNWPTNSDLLLNNSLLELSYFDSFPFQHTKKIKM